MTRMLKTVLDLDIKSLYHLVIDGDDFWMINGELFKLGNRTNTGLLFFEDEEDLPDTLQRLLLFVDSLAVNHSSSAFSGIMLADNRGYPWNSMSYGDPVVVGFASGVWTGTKMVIESVGDILYHDLNKAIIDIRMGTLIPNSYKAEFFSWLHPSEKKNRLADKFRKAHNQMTLMTASVNS